MDLILKRGPSETKQEPLLIQYEKDGKKITQKVKVAEVVAFPDQLAYEIMAKYPNFFEPVAKKPEEYKTKVMKPE